MWPVNFRVNEITLIPVSTIWNTDAIWYHLWSVISDHKGQEFDALFENVIAHLIFINVAILFDICVFVSLCLIIQQCLLLLWNVYYFCEILCMDVIVSVLRLYFSTAMRRDPIIDVKSIHSCEHTGICNCLRDISQWSRTECLRVCVLKLHGYIWKCEICIRKISIIIISNI